MKLTFLILVIFGVLVLAWEADSAECPIKCPNETKWQCGRERQPDGSWKYVTFKSLCYLIMTNTCLGGVLVLAWEADSAECPIKCPNETKWQCGRERQPDGSWNRL
ncbi:unnamed protein product [Nezara viridula]|uniref:Neuropeptide n=1 Tax=Nezara viridula TaxID=85310 RepID=A0A9P0E476_NEZVI|nr:unnamed protein product [Nezara viridula]